MSGTQQSPINIASPISAAIGKLDIHWKKVQTTLRWHGDRIESIEFSPGCLLTIDTTTYVLKSAHMHSPSEHQVNGVAYDAEMHFVHVADDGRLAVVGVFTVTGTVNGALDELLGRGSEHSSSFTFDPTSLLPTDHSYYRYAGSLTTSPYSETVTWSVLKASVGASMIQHAMFPEPERPIQPTNRRYVLSST